jgi:hypothetical protein
MDEKEFEDLSEKIYVEFAIDGVIITSPKDVDKVKVKISKLIQKVFKEYGSSKVNVQISSFSEEDVALSIMQSSYSDQEH